MRYKTHSSCGLTRRIRRPDNVQLGARRPTRCPGEGRRRSGPGASVTTIPIHRGDDNEPQLPGCSQSRDRRRRAGGTGSSPRLLKQYWRVLEPLVPGWLLHRGGGPRHGYQREQCQGHAAPRSAGGCSAGTGGRPMTNRGVEAFVDAILADQPSKRFSATPDDADLLRLAIELHVSRSGKIGPDPQFVRELGRQLAAAADTGAIVSLRPGAEASERGPAPLMPGLRPASGPNFPSARQPHRCRGRRLAPGGRYVRCRQSRATCAASSRGASSSHCHRHGALWHPLDQRRRSPWVTLMLTAGTPPGS